MFHPTAAQDHAIRELQGKQIAVVDGAAVDTNIAIAGITTADTLGAVIRFVTDTPTSNLVDEAAITSDGNIQLSSTNTTGNKLIVEWYPHVGS